MKGFNSRFGQFKLSKSKIESLSPSPFRSCNLVFFFFFVEQINAGDFPGLTVVLFTKRPNEPLELVIRKLTFVGLLYSMLKKLEIMQRFFQFAVRK